MSDSQGFEKVYKNSTYKRKPKGFFDKLKQDEQKRGERARLFMQNISDTTKREGRGFQGEGFPLIILFDNYMLRIKKRFNARYNLDDIDEVNSQKSEIKRELKLFYTEERRKWACPCLDFIERNSKGLFLYKKLPEKEIEHTNNAAEIIFSLFKPQYKVMKQFQTPEAVQIHLDLFTLRHNLRVFPRGKRKGYSPVQREGLNVSLNDWADLLYSDKAIPEEALFLSGRTKEIASSKKCAASL